VIEMMSEFRKIKMDDFQCPSPSNYEEYQQRVVKEHKQAVEAASMTGVNALVKACGQASISMNELMAWSKAMWSTEFVACVEELVIRHKPVKRDLDDDPTDDTDNWTTTDFFNHVHNLVTANEKGPLGEMKLLTTKKATRRVKHLAAFALYCNKMAREQPPFALSKEAKLEWNTTAWNGVCNLCLNEMSYLATVITFRTK